MVYIIAQALKTLKSHNFIHRDIKPDNILIKGDTVKLADFGFCTKNNSRNNGIVGSPLYMSPESLQQFTYDTKGDIYALGITLYQMLTNNVPFYDRQMDPLIQKKLSFNIMEDQSNISLKCKQLLGLMLNVDKKLRPDPLELIDLIDVTFPRIKYFSPKFNFKRSVNRDKKNSAPVSDFKPLNYTYNQD